MARALKLPALCPIGAAAAAAALPPPGGTLGQHACALESRASALDRLLALAAAVQGVERLQGVQPSIARLARHPLALTLGGHALWLVTHGGCWAVAGLMGARGEFGQAAAGLAGRLQAERAQT